MDLTIANMPSEFVGLSLALLLSGLVVALYRMRDPNPFPRYFARRLECPQTGRRFTVEFSARGTVGSCSAFRYGELSCNQACARRLKTENALATAAHIGRTLRHRTTLRH